MKSFSFQKPFFFSGGGGPTLTYDFPPTPHPIFVCGSNHAMKPSWLVRIRKWVPNERDDLPGDFERGRLSPMSMMNSEFKIQNCEMFNSTLVALYTILQHSEYTHISAL